MRRETTVERVLTPLFSWLLVRSTQTLTDRMVDKVDEELKPEIIHWAAEYVSLTILRRVG